MLLFADDDHLVITISLLFHYERSVVGMTYITDVNKRIENANDRDRDNDAPDKILSRLLNLAEYLWKPVSHRFYYR